MEGQQVNAQPVIERINDEYEYIQYNSKLRLLHSIKDDMFQAQSILTSCQSTKKVNDWFRRKTTQELITELSRNSTGRNPPVELSKCEGTGNLAPSNDGDIKGIYEVRMNVRPGLQGIYIHRLLVNHIAIWCSPVYSLYIMKLLDSTFQQERNRLLNKIEEHKPRLVPDNHEKDYFYLLWKEDLNDEECILHQVRRNKATFAKIKSHFNNENEKVLFRDKLPIAMTPSSDIKNIIRDSFRGNEYKMRKYDIVFKKANLPTLIESITNYFNNFQE